MAATGAMPVPFNISAWVGGCETLSVTARVAVLAPRACGVKVIETRQWAPAARVAPQADVAVKSFTLVPVTAMLEILSGARPVFVSVTVCAALVVRTN